MSNRYHKFKASKLFRKLAKIEYHFKIIFDAYQRSLNFSNDTAPLFPLSSSIRNTLTVNA